MDVIDAWCPVHIHRNGDSCVSPSFQFDSICFIRIELTYNWMAFGITLTILFSAIFCLITAKFRLNRELKHGVEGIEKRKNSARLMNSFTGTGVCVGLTETNLDVSDNTKLLCSINAPNTYHESVGRARVNLQKATVLRRINESASRNCVDVDATALREWRHKMFCWNNHSAHHKMRIGEIWWMMRVGRVFKIDGEKKRLARARWMRKEAN